MNKRKLGVTEIKRIDNHRLANSLKSDRPIIVKSAEDLPPVSKKIQAAYDFNREVAAAMAISIQQTVRVWVCYNCRRIINLADCEQPDLVDSNVKLIDCPRCKVSKAELMGVFNPDFPI